jgi:hypothetical protein
VIIGIPPISYNNLNTMVFQEEEKSPQPKLEAL